MKYKFLSLFVILTYCLTARAVCPDFTDLSSSYVTATTGKRSNPFDNTGVVDGRHTLITAQGTDPNTGGMLQLLPPGERQVIKLGNDHIGAESEALTYRFMVDKENAALLLKFAVVLEGPNHVFIAQPRFVVRITDDAGNLIEECAEYEVRTGADISDFQIYQKSSWQIIRWRDWTNVGLDLSKYIGKTVQVQFITYDCSWDAHFGYAYFTASCMSNTLQLGDCGGGSYTIEAPDYFVSYLWDNGDQTHATTRLSSDTNTPISCLVTSATGCQSTLSGYVTNTTGAVSESIQASICEGESYAENYFNLPSQFSGIHTYYNTFINPAACSSQATELQLDVIQRYNHFKGAICHGADYIANGFNIIQPAVGVRRDTVKVGDGVDCDEYNILELTVSMSLAMPNIIEGDASPCTDELVTYAFTGLETLTRFEWEFPDNAVVVRGKNTSVVTLYFTDDTPGQIILKGENGCGTGSTSLSVDPRQTHHIQFNEQICQGNEYNDYDFNLGIQDSVGYFVYEKHLQSSLGCDSSVVLALNVLPTPVVRIEPKDPMICNPDDEIKLYAVTGDLEWEEDDDADDYPFALIYDCDLTYYWNTGQTTADITENPTETTTYTVTVTTENGCSATASQAVLVNKNAPIIVNDTICSGETYTGYGLSETTTGSYGTTIQNNDCDVPVTVNLFVHPPATRKIIDEVCEGERYIKHDLDIQLYQPGIFRDTMHFLSYSGCDSTLILEIKVHPAQDTLLYDTVCQNSPYNNNGFNLSAQTIAGEFTHTRTAKTSQNCDSTITLKLLVTPVHTNTISDEVEKNGAYSKYDFNFPIVTKDTTATKSLRNVAGCDSTVILNLKAVSVSQQATSDKYMQVLTCHNATVLDVLLNDAIIHCDRDEINLTITSASKVGASVSVNENKDIVYTRADGFIGHDTLEYTANCPNKIYSAKVFITVIECPDNIDDADCFLEPPSIEFGIKLLYKSPDGDKVNNTTTPVIGDIDGDGKTEILVLNNIATATNNSQHNAIYVYGVNHLTNSLYRKYTIDVSQSGASGVTNTYAFSPIAIAKVNGDSYASIFFASIHEGKLYKYVFDGNSWTQQWNVVYTTNSTYYAVSPAVADIMGNGRTQIVILDKIIDTKNGAILANGGLIPASGRSTSYSFGCFGHAKAVGGGSVNYYESSLVVVDIDGDGIMEVIGGNCVYGINLVDFDNPNYSNSFTLKMKTNNTEHPEIGDGGTAVADVDNCGQLEVIVSGPVANGFTTALNGMLYIYNPRTGEVLHKNQIEDIPRYNNNLGPSRPSVGDFNNDGDSEIALTGAYTLRCYKYNILTQNLDTKWIFSTTDASGSTGLTAFDFAHDGKNRLVYRDEKQLRIINASGAIPIIDAAIDNTESGTVNESAVVADINADGAAEIIVVANDFGNCNNGGTCDHHGELRVFASNDKPWAPARSVWNQQSYYVLNINEDLTIPQIPMSQAKLFPGKDGILGTDDDVRPYNNFLQQQTMLNKNGNPLWVVPDYKLLDNWTVKTNVDQSATIRFCVTNVGNANGSTPLYVSLYDDTWKAENLVITKDLNRIPVVGDTICYELLIPDIELSSFILSINDKGQAGHVAPECDYENNKQDIIVGLIANNDYALTIVDVPIQINVLENDSLYNCSGAILDGFGTISNSGPENGMLTINPDSTFTYVSQTAGIDSVDYYIKCTADSSIGRVYMLVLEPLSMQYVACPDDVITMGFEEITGVTYDWYNAETGGNIVKNGTAVPELVITKGSADDISIWWVEPEWKGFKYPRQKVELEDDNCIPECPVNETNLTESICQNDSYLFDGQMLTESGIYRNTITLESGCDSIVILNLTVHLPDTTRLSHTIYVGEGYTENGFDILPQPISGVLADTLSWQNQYDCDSTVILNLEIICPVNETNLTESICQNDSYLFDGQMLTESGIYRNTITLENGCDSIVILHLTVHLPDTTRLSHTIYVGEGYTENGFDIPPQPISGVLADTLSWQNQYDCDSTVILNLEIICPVNETNLTESICQNDSYLFDGQMLTESGIYRNTITLENGCDSIVILNLTVQDSSLITVTPDNQNICQDGEQEISLTAKIESGIPTEIVWYDGDRTSIEPDRTSSKWGVKPLESESIYWAYATDPVCGDSPHAYTTVFVTNKVYLFLRADTTAVQIGSEITLTVTSTNDEHNNYRWYDNTGKLLGETTANTFKYTLDEQGVFAFYVLTGNGYCLDAESNTVSAEVKDYWLIPNIITPYNDNSKNNTFMTPTDKRPGYRVEIYNRYQQRIFEGDNGWDGTYRGKLAEPGTYFYRLFMKDGQIQKGTLEVAKF